MLRPEKGSKLNDFPTDYIAIDLETTGFSPEYDEIIEIAGIKVSNGIVVDSFSSLVRPENIISDTIVKLTGITNSMAKQGEPISEVLPRFMSFVGDSVLVGHNVSFDINFLYDNLMRIEKKPLRNDYIDTMWIARKLYSSLPHHRLGDLVDYLQIPASTFHRAVSDCDLTIQLFNRMKQDATLKFGSTQRLFYKPVSHGVTKKKLDARTITATVSNIDPAHPIYGKVCVFTGTLDSMARREAMQLVVNFGGICDNRITQNTNFLILGNNDYCKTIVNGKSNKQKKAESYIEKGFDLKIIPEDVFLDMFEGYDLVESPAPASSQIVQEDTTAKAIEIIRDIVPGDISEESRASAYTTLLTPNGVDFCRVKFTPRTAWFSLDIWSSHSIKDDALLKDVKNKNQRHWKIYVSSTDDLEKFAHIISAVYESCAKR